MICSNSYYLAQQEAKEEEMDRKHEELEEAHEDLLSNCSDEVIKALQKLKKRMDGCADDFGLDKDSETESKGVVQAALDLFGN